MKEIGFNDTMPFTVKESTQNIVDNIFDSLNIPLDRIVKVFCKQIWMRIQRGNK